MSTVPEVTQTIWADEFSVTVDVKAALLEHLPAVLRALSGHGREQDVFVTSANAARMAIALADLRDAVQRNLAALPVDLTHTEATDLAEALRDAATEPDLCPRAYCPRYEVSCDVHGSVEFVAEPAEHVA